ncbi:hypothetical protein HDU97_008717 [Phlyctochytrium planicorne]|nr:hypothetical protein HDU97_008717 [Phlyctochytrium planicorne]
MAESAFSTSSSAAPTETSQAAKDLLASPEAQNIMSTSLSPSTAAVASSSTSTLASTTTSTSASASTTASTLPSTTVMVATTTSSEVAETTAAEVVVEELSTKEQCSVLADAFPTLRISRTECCMWKRVKCENGSIVELNFQEMGLNGIFPESITKLRGLQSLLLSQNSLKGSIPEDIGTLPVLENLWASNNQLRGVIPLSIGASTSLKQLHLNGNNLHGPVPLGLAKVQGIKPASKAEVIDSSGNGTSSSLASKKQVGLAIGLPVLFLVMAMVVLGSLLAWRKRDGSKKKPGDDLNWEPLEEVEDFE